MVCGARPGERHIAARHQPEPERPKRMTLAEQNRELFALLARPPRDRSSITISRNAKQHYQFEVVVHAGDVGADTLEDAERLAIAITDRLATKYPPPVEPAP